MVVTPDNLLTYSYDARGNLTEAADTDSRVGFAYDTLNRLISTTTDGTIGLQPQVTLSYTYDELDRRLIMSDSLGGTTQYAWDVEDRLTKLTAPWGTEYSFGYDGEGRRTSLTSTSGRSSTYTYTNGLLTALHHAQSGVPLTDLEYQYDPDGQLTAILDKLDPSKSRFISYDRLNRLVQVDKGVPPVDGGVPVPVEDYAYDAEGNRLASHLSAFYSSNAHNQLTEDDDYTYAYDERGNRITRTSKSTGDVERYAYDSQNRLVGYANPTLSARYAYDALERRIAKVIDGPGESIDPPGREPNQAVKMIDQGAVDIEDMVLAGPFTIEGWIRLEPGQAINNRDGLVRSDTAQPTQDLNFAFQRLRLYSPGSGAVDKVAASTSAVAGVWTHYAVTRDDAGTLRLYVNGALDATGAEPFTLPFHVGFLGRTAAGVSHAQFDDIRIWSVARSEAEIAATRSVLIDPATPGLERLYTFEGSSTEVTDQTGNSAAGVLGNGTTIIASGAPTTTAPLAPGAPGPNADVTAYVYDIAPRHALAHDDITMEFSGGVLKRRWMHSNAVDEPVGFEEYIATSGVGSGNERLMYADRQGSVIWVTEPVTGSVVAAYEYDGYGTITQTQGSLVQPYGYTGREYDPESGLYYYRARSYDPVAGAFLQDDPLGLADGLNLYRYVAGSPFRWTDPMGTNQTMVGAFGTGLTAAAAGARAEQVFTGAITLAGRINAALRTITLITRPGAEAKTVTVNDFPPPGDCDPDEHRQLQDRINELKGLPKCNANMPWFKLGQLEHYFHKRARLRAQINAKCFRGGDDGHRQAERDDSNAARNCREEMAIKAGRW